MTKAKIIDLVNSLTKVSLLVSLSLKSEVSDMLHIVYPT